VRVVTDDGLVRVELHLAVDWGASIPELGRDVTHGHKIAATGELAPNGAVEPIGGVKQKAIGVRRAKVDVFLVPAGDNVKEARKYAGPVRVIPVESFRQALRALATLPPKR